MELADLPAAKLQLAELQLQWQCAQDARLALSIFLSSNGSDQTLHESHTSLPDAWQEEQSLQQQMDFLSLFIASCEDQQAASCMQDNEATMQHATLQLAQALEAQEHWDARVLRPHDAAFARALSTCSSGEWEEFGDVFSRPLDTTCRPDRPPSPDLPSSAAPNNPAAAAAAAAAACSSSSSSSCGCPPNAPAATYFSGVSITGGPCVAYCQPDPSNPQPANGGQGTDDKGKAPAAKHSTHSTAACSSSSTRDQDIQCTICFDRFPASGMVAASLPPGVAASSSSQGRCGHLFCSGCMRQYVRSAVQARRHPICCPTPSCQESLAHEDVVLLLAEAPKDLQVYEALVAEQAIDSALRAYCPYKDCSCLLERPEGEGVGQQGQEEPYECPACHRVFCLSCSITGWHTGLSCSQFQALPPELRSVEDAAMLRMAAAQAWKRCPAAGCGHVVERTEGCNHMRCRCGCSFCYACGSPYRGAEPTADNVHGTPACVCPLFAVPEDPEGEDEEQQEQAVPVPRPVVLHRPRPWRNGRQVSRTPCRHSLSIHDCPMGPARCWFSHIEDDM